MRDQEYVRALGYIRCSTEEQADSGAGLEAQRETLRQECDRRGWKLELVEDAGYSAKTLGRPALQTALQALKRGEADALIATKLDRLSRSIIDFSALMELARKQGWSLVVLDCPLDMTTPVGEAVANVLATFAQLERRLIGQRTKEAMAVKKAQGARFGHPSRIGPELALRIRADRENGLTLQLIADRLNSEGVPTVQGGSRWWPSTVQHVVRATGRAEPLPA